MEDRNKEQQNKKKPRFFNPRLFFMDMARIVCSPLPAVFRLKRVFASSKAEEKLKGGAIIAANHTGFSDPFVLGTTFWYRRMFFLAAEVVMKNKIVEILLKGVGCIKINRNICDIESVRKSVSVLKKGHLLALFPQGAIDREGDMSAIKTGIILMAMQSKVPIVPVYVHKKTKRGERNVVVIGEPIDLFSGDNSAGIKGINNQADYVLEKMNECKEIYENLRRK